MITVTTNPIDDGTARARLHKLQSIVDQWRDHWLTGQEALELVGQVVDAGRVVNYELTAAPTGSAQLCVDFRQACASASAGRIVRRLSWGIGWLLHYGADGMYALHPREAGQSMLKSCDFSATDWVVM